MKVFSILLFVFISFGTLAQKDSELLLTINAQLDEGVVKKDIAFLQSIMPMILCLLMVAV